MSAAAKKSTKESGTFKVAAVKAKDVESWETDEMHAAGFARSARKDARRIAWLVQEAIGCEEEVEKMPLVAKAVQDLLNNLERAVSLLGKHRRAWLAVVNSKEHKRAVTAWLERSAASHGEAR